MIKRHLTGLILLIIVGLMTVPLLGAQDNDGDFVPDSQDKYANRNDLKYGGTLTYIVPAEPTTMDTLRTAWGTGAHMLISESPVTIFSPYEGTQSIVKNGWLESLDVSPDQKTWTFYIREGVKFHDGVSLNAETFATILKNRKEKSAMYGAPLRFTPKENIKVIDEYTLQLEMERYTPGFFTELSDFAWFGGMGTPNAIEKYGEEYGSTMAYGNGPFKLQEWVKGDHLTFVRNEEFDWAPGFANNPGPPFLDKVVLKVVPETVTQVQMLKRGEVDGSIMVPWSKAEEVKKIEGLDVRSIPFDRLFYIELDTRDFPLNDQKVRQALNYAVNKIGIAEKIFYGYAEPAYSLYLANWLEYSGRTKHMYRYDLEKAKELLDKAGWKDSDGDGIREKDGKELEFNLWTSKLEMNSKLAVIVQGMWRKIGVKAVVTKMDNSTLREKVYGGEAEATVWTHTWPYLAGMNDWWFDPEGCPYPQINCLDTPELRDLIKRTREAQSREEYEIASDDIANYNLEQAIAVPLVKPNYLVAFKEKFKNIIIRYAGGIAPKPYLYDAYSTEIYQDNLDKWTK